ncbi:hypothetical protein AMECASPLE_031132 [Ameca splendens]|uniref:Secreted protein n=1 Tax=Ameca splendens TaxID=208324 RepID=A0ABV0XVF5_9TELE
MFFTSVFYLISFIAHCLITQHMARWEQLFLAHCLSVYTADREREAVLEAGVGGGDGEGLVAVRQFASKQRGLAKPCTQFSTFSNTVGPLIQFYKEGKYSGLCKFSLNNR